MMEIMAFRLLLSGVSRPAQTVAPTTAKSTRVNDVLPAVKSMNRELKNLDNKMKSVGRVHHCYAPKKR